MQNTFLRATTVKRGFRGSTKGNCGGGGGIEVILTFEICNIDKDKLRVLVRWMFTTQHCCLLAKHELKSVCTLIVSNPGLFLFLLLLLPLVWFLLFSFLLEAIKPLFELFFFRTAPSSHILPLRRFIENVVDSDLRSFFASSCFKVSFSFNVW